MNKRIKYKKQMQRDIELFMFYNQDNPVITLKVATRTIKKHRRCNIFNPIYYNLKTGKAIRNKYPPRLCY